MSKDEVATLLGKPQWWQVGSRPFDPDTISHADRPRLLIKTNQGLKVYEDWWVYGASDEALAKLQGVDQQNELAEPPGGAFVVWFNKQGRVYTVTGPAPLSPPVPEPRYDPVMGPPRSPLSWKTVRAKSGLAKHEASSIAKRLMGSAKPWKVERADLVEITDEHPFGENVSGRLAWLIWFPEVSVSYNRYRVSNVDICVAIDARHGQLLAAFTRSASKWIQPVMKPVNPETAIEIRNWEFTPAVTKNPNLEIPEVFGLGWQGSGFVSNPAGVGQVIIRPRRVIRPSGLAGRWREPALEWIVEVLGGGPWWRTRPPPSPVTVPELRKYGRWYQTSRVLVVEDDTGAPWNPLTLP